MQLLKEQGTRFFLLAVALWLSGCLSPPVDADALEDEPAKTELVERKGCAVNYDPRWGRGFGDQPLNTGAMNLGQQERFNSSRLGNSDVLECPFPSAIIPVSANPTQIPTTPKLLLEADLKGIGNEWQAGSWVLTIDNVATFDVPPGPDPYYRIIPTKAIITIGTGGSVQTFEVDTRNNSFQLPAATVRIDIQWDNTIPANYTSGNDRFVIPREVRVVAQIQRGYSNGSARRTIWTPLFTSSQPIPSLFRGRIPNFAHCVRVLGLRSLPDDFFTTGNLEFETDAGGLGLPLIDYTGPQLLNPSGVVVPSAAQDFALSVPRPTSYAVSTVHAMEFDIEL